MLLGEVDGPRKLPVIIGASEAQAMLIEIKGIIPPRPMTHNLFASVLEVLGVKLTRVLIYKVDNGVFYSYLYLKAEETMLRVDARTSDAVALSLRMSAPIYVYEDILNAERVKIEEDADEGSHITKASTPEEALAELKSALQKAVNEENYERAAQLRDQINRQLNSNP